MLVGSFRGYAGEISPAAALDAVASGGNIFIVDIRTSREKENGGVPDLPSGNRWDISSSQNIFSDQPGVMLVLPICEAVVKVTLCSWSQAMSTRVNLLT